MTNPRTETLAYLIWHHAEARGWDCTVNDIAESIEAHFPVTYHHVRRACQTKGWLHRLRGVKDTDPRGDWRLAL